jgi:hypothetical protein
MTSIDLPATRSHRGVRPVSRPRAPGPRCPRRGDAQRKPRIIGCRCTVACLLWARYRSRLRVRLPVSTLLKALTLTGKYAIHSHDLQADRILDRCKKLTCRVDQLVTDFVEGLSGPRRNVRHVCLPCVPFAECARSRARTGPGACPEGRHRGRMRSVSYLSQAPKATWLLMASKASLASCWVAFTWVYQVEPPTLDTPFS